MPAVIYYVMGPFDGTPSSGNVWKTSDQWPVPSTPLVLYLTKEHQLSTKASDDRETIIYEVDSANLSLLWEEEIYFCPPVPQIKDLSKLEKM